MEEIKVGEYIRTIEPYGEIFKVIGIGKEEVLIVDSYENSLVATGYVKKHSSNIIDVIEVGDYVNGYKVKGKTNNKVLVNYYMYSEQLAGGFWLTFYEDEIKNIVTHEQFNSIKYEVI